MALEPPSLIEVFRSDYATCFRNGVALQAAAIDYQLLQSGGEWALFVASRDANRARDELRAYADEIAGPAVAAPSRLEQFNGWIGVIGFAVVLVSAVLIQHHTAFGSHWFTVGRMQVGLVRQGEVWRAFTALTLHGDLVHLLSNLAIGGIVGLFAGQLFGSGLGWLNILLAGGIGNLFTVVFRSAEHTSIGASTSVFAALGLLAGHAWVLRRPARESLLARFAPIIGGAILLGFLGSSGERTDVLAHVMGFLSGLGLGASLSKLSHRIPLGPGAQIVYGVGALAVLVLAWALALSTVR